MASINKKKIGSVENLAPGSTYNFQWNNPPQATVLAAAHHIGDRYRESVAATDSQIRKTGALSKVRLGSHRRIAASPVPGVA